MSMSAIAPPSSWKVEAVLVLNRQASENVIFAKMVLLECPISLISSEVSERQIIEMLATLR